MKKIIKFFVICFLMISLSACGKTAEPEVTPTSSVSMDDVFTAVVLTLTDQASHFTPTPSETTTVTSTVTPVPSNTAVQNTPTTAKNTQVVSNSTANGCNDAVYVSDVTIPDGTTMAAGQSFTKTWSLKNIGSCNWDTTYKLMYISGEKMRASDTAITSTVNVGSSGNVSVAMVAPSSTGTYYSYWQMADSTGNRFGGQIYVMIKVGSGGTTTITATTVATTAQTSTPTITTAANTATPTDTTVPEETTESSE